LSFGSFEERVYAHIGMGGTLSMKKIYSAFFVFLEFLMLLYPTPAHASPRVGTGVYFDNIVTILMENTGINSTYDYCPSTPGCYVVGNSNAPFMNSIYPTRTAPFVSAFAEGYSGTAHPSAPNYESLLSGLENGLGGNYSSDSQVNWLDLGSNLVDSFTGAGVTWTAYAEGATGSGTCSFSRPR